MNQGMKVTYTNRKTLQNQKLTKTIPKTHEPGDEAYNQQLHVTIIAIKNNEA
jgi:hypothetical protein